ncbi:MAG: glutamate--tRNA ligase family protein [Candidatus Binatia bacterium]
MSSPVSDPLQQAATSRAPRGRFAPSPTGLLHVGNARTALVAWLSVRSRRGTFVWRLEDLDPPRIVRGAAEAAVEDLAWLGLDWDEDPEAGGPFAPYVQSGRSDVYEAALRRLAEGGRLFPCTLSRRELASISSAPHPGEEESPYPASARPTHLPDDWYDRLPKDGGAALRFRVDEEAVHFSDRVYGEFKERVAGDFVLRRRDGLYAYQLAVAVDDWLMEIDEVVRGSDLLGSTARQLQILDALGARRPLHAHVPMVVTTDGDKLSKRDEALTLRSLRESGVKAAQLAGYLGWSLGLLERPAAISANELVEVFSWNRIGSEDWPLPADFPDRVRRLR